MYRIVPYRIAVYSYIARSTWSFISLLFLLRLFRCVRIYSTNKISKFPLKSSFQWKIVAFRHQYFFFVRMSFTIINSKTLISKIDLHIKCTECVCTQCACMYDCIGIVSLFQYTQNVHMVIYHGPFICARMLFDFHFSRLLLICF